MQVGTICVAIQINIMDTRKSKSEWRAEKSVKRREGKFQTGPGAQHSAQQICPYNSYDDSSFIIMNLIPYSF